MYDVTSLVAAGAVVAGIAVGAFVGAFVGVLVGVFVGVVVAFTVGEGVLVVVPATIFTVGVGVLVGEAEGVMVACWRSSFLSVIFCHKASNFLSAEDTFVALGIFVLCDAAAGSAVRLRVIINVKAVSR